MGFRSDGQLFQAHGDGDLRAGLDFYLDKAGVRAPMSLDTYKGKEGWVEE
jgi:hypothetical protein